MVLIDLLGRKKNRDHCFGKSGEQHGICSPDPSRMSVCLTSKGGLWAESQGKMGPLEMQTSLIHNEIFFMKKHDKGATQAHRTGILMLNVIIKVYIYINNTLKGWNRLSYSGKKQ